MARTAYQRRYRRRGKPRGPAPDETSIAKAKRHARANALVALRCAGKSLYTIGQLQTPKISAPRVYQIITDFLAETQVEVVEKVREIEIARLDMMLERVWPAAAGIGSEPVEGAEIVAMPLDYAAIDRVLAIMRRKTQLMGADLQPMVGRGDASRFNPDGTRAPDPVVHLIIDGDPEPQRIRWLEDQARLGRTSRGPTDNLQ